jgi:hypothetical protein
MGYHPKKTNSNKQSLKEKELPLQHLARMTPTDAEQISKMEAKNWKKTPAPKCKFQTHFVTDIQKEYLLGEKEKRIYLLIYRMVICLAICALLPTPPSRAAEALEPAFRSKTFQNFKLSSAAAVASICPSGLRQL